MENLQEQFEIAANEWYEAIIKRTGLNLKPNKRSLNGFVKGAEFGYNIATQLAAEDKKELLEALKLCYCNELDKLSIMAVIKKHETL
jgi:hypothetical protein